VSAPAWTPGPWFARNIGEKENCYAIGVPDDEGYGDAVCFVEEGSHATDGCLHADARLIAAAPSLYEALVEAEKAIDDCLNFRSHLSYAARDRARAALAKARGEQ
jgi:hypothetical protein